LIYKFEDRLRFSGTHLVRAGVGSRSDYLDNVIPSAAPIRSSDAARILARFI
jgi:hypothetical protein